MTKRENIIRENADNVERQINELFNKTYIELIISVKENYPETSTEYKMANKLYKLLQKLERAEYEFVMNTSQLEYRFNKLKNELYTLLVTDIYKKNGIEKSDLRIYGNIEQFRGFRFTHIEFKQIDEATEKPKSIDEQVINDLQIHFKPSKTFKGVNNEIIKQKLGINISDKKLKQLIKKAFKNIKIRGSNNYFLETI